MQKIFDNQKLTFSRGVCATVGPTLFLVSIGIIQFLHKADNSKKSKLLHSFLWIAAGCYLLSGALLTLFAFYNSSRIPITKIRCIDQSDALLILYLGIVFTGIPIARCALREAGLFIGSFVIEIKGKWERADGMRAFFCVCWDTAKTYGSFLINKIKHAIISFQDKHKKKKTELENRRNS